MKGNAIGGVLLRLHRLRMIQNAFGGNNVHEYLDELISSLST
jgi:hypothetical protein